MSDMAARARFTCACGGCGKCGRADIKVNAYKFTRFSSNRSFRLRQRRSRGGGSAIMPDTVSGPPKMESRDSGRADQDAFAQVEKWLAVIRELAREQAQRARTLPD